MQSPMKNKIYIAPEARRDLNEIYDYIMFDLSNPAAAIGIIDQIMDTIDRLVDFPYLGALLSSIANIESNYRYLTVGNYMAFYRVMGENIFVDRILYGRRDYLRILFDE